ncbi:hypothetical protein K2173_006461 [Erythroxylum novogranatense]|uniref:Uncharacterized protein n=1 Tax=Erythroxylum novogranatense TaxID=1862640 RepID=A0AAV8TE68_9ROSI|nr:hypothetical protein K2173_006461 [Erythroxylum novogranatense]
MSDTARSRSSSGMATATRGQRQPSKLQQRRPTSLKITPCRRPPPTGTWQSPSFPAQHIADCGGAQLQTGSAGAGTKGSRYDGVQEVAASGCAVLLRIRADVFCADVDVASKIRGSQQRALCLGAVFSSKCDIIVTLN